MYETQTPVREKERAGSQPPQTVTMGDMVNMTDYYIDLQRQRQAKPGVSPQEFESAATTIREMGETSQILQSLDVSGVPTESAQQAILERLKRLPEEISDPKARVGEESKLQKALDFVGNNVSNTGLLENPRFKELVAQKKDRQANLHEAARAKKEKRQATQRTRVEAQARENVAEAMEAKVVDDALKQGGVKIMTALPAEYSDSGRSGFAFRGEGRRTGSEKYSAFSLRDTAGVFDVDGYTSSFDKQRFFGGQGIHEGVVFRPFKKPVMRDEPVKKQKKLFGHSQPAYERRQVGEEPVKASEIVEGSSDEPAVECSILLLAIPNIGKRLAIDATMVEMAITWMCL